MQMIENENEFKNTNFDQSHTFRFQKGYTGINNYKTY